MSKEELVIVGQGPAGLSAAIYAGRAGIQTLVIGCNPKVAGNYQIDNYFGFPDPISGGELIKRGTEQALKYGVQLRSERVLKIYPESDGSYTVTSEDGRIDAWAVILATGVSRIRPGIDNLPDYEGHGVAYCVSCDGFFYRNKKVMVLGEGLFAANQALDLLQFTDQVSICTQGKPLDMTPAFLEKLSAAAIPILDRRIVTLKGNTDLKGVRFEDTGEETLDGLFVAMGQEASATDFAYTLGLVRNGQFIAADEKQQTNLPGIFAAGDCVGRFMQISVAVGEGALAARSAIGYVKKIRRSL